LQSQWYHANTFLPLKEENPIYIYIYIYTTIKSMHRLTSTVKNLVGEMHLYQCTQAFAMFIHY